MRRVSLLVGILSLVGLVLVSCGSSSIDRMEGVEKSQTGTKEDWYRSHRETGYGREYIDFSLDLCRDQFREQSFLYSPLSLISALGMTSNGMAGQTLDQLEESLKLDRQTINRYNQAYQNILAKEGEVNLDLANGIWLNQSMGLDINRAFLQANKDYYDASLYETLFNKGTKKEINKWVKDKTKGLVYPFLQEDIPAHTLMYIISAVSFEAEWEEIYEKNQMYKGDFYPELGKKETATYMTSWEGTYLENQWATGFVKPYKGGRYVFAALLPREGLAMSDFLDQMGGQDLYRVLEEGQDLPVYVEMPKFSFEDQGDLSQALKNLGIRDAFDRKEADFSALGRTKGEQVYISQILHASKLVLDERGTKAGAVTGVEMEAISVMEERKEVRLNRPFFYLIMDRQEKLPLFVGCMMSLG